MSKTQRRKINIKTVKDVSSLGQVTKKELLAESQRYDKGKYNPLDNLEEKKLLIPEQKTEVITIRLTERENEQISKIARENGLSKSALVRMLVTRSLKKTDFF
ncbi:plasmid mobilization protein [Desulfoscipio sp. XC116]|uniref:plasmid mobilization protein n=1 Tax=Desulfoscipio sp. XC116 TaxID=3144975 RepID=UPI00325A6603